MQAETALAVTCARPQLNAGGLWNLGNAGQTTDLCSAPTIAAGCVSDGAEKYAQREREQRAWLAEQVGNPTPQDPILNVEQYEYCRWLLTLPTLQEVARELSLAPKRRPRGER